MHQFCGEGEERFGSDDASVAAISLQASSGVTQNNTIIGA